MIEKNCLTCSKFIGNKPASTSRSIKIDLKKGNDKIKVCDFYPDNLSTARDIMEGYSCNEWEEFTVNNAPKMPDMSQGFPPMQITPFTIMSGGFNEYQKMISDKKKEIDKIERSLRKAYWCYGFITGLCVGLNIIIIMMMTRIL